MKNKESRPKSVRNSFNSKKSAKRQTTEEKIEKNKEPTISQINRLKKFYNTTRWLPNSSFTTFLGRPAFENYGYGNTKPVYGGLFYGNYMLSHNINPVDGPNIPSEKQVYASSMLKASKNLNPRKPNPPRKVPDEIRNTPDELKEILSRNPVFQKSNNFPNREIIKPNLIKAKYFRSPKGTPERDRITQETSNEEFDLHGFLNGRGGFRKKQNITNKSNDLNFFNKNDKKKVIKVKLDNENPEGYVRPDFKGSKYSKNTNNSEVMNENNNTSQEKNITLENENNNDKNIKKLEVDNSNIEGKLLDFYKKMLGEKCNENDNDMENNKDRKKNEDLNNSELGNMNMSTNISMNASRQILKKKENNSLINNGEIK